jgi:S1-C subfamily serine protease
MSALEDLQVSIGRVVESVGPAVVGIGRGWHPGSGVVVAEGRLVTSAHNVPGDEATISFSDGRSAPARVLGLDPKLDVAVLSADTGDIAPVAWTPEETAAAIGTAVVALANPGGRGLRATLGFVSSTGRSFRGPRGRRIRGCIEHSAPLPRGSAGGPLVDSAGLLLGLNTVRLAEGLILAVPADSGLRQSVDALWRGEVPTPVRLGVAVAPSYVARRLRRAVGLPESDGVLVRSVQEGSAAERAGLEQGDLIIAAADRPIDRVDALYESLDQVEPGETLRLRILRGAEEKEVTVSFNQVGEEVER